MRRPRELYQPSPQALSGTAARMGVSGGSEVKRLNTQGMLEDGGRRWFVCGALAGQRVRIERIDAKLLVSYRHMYIREIDKERACTRPLVVARREARRRRAGGPSGRPPGSLRPRPKTRPEV